MWSPVYEQLKCGNQATRFGPHMNYRIFVEHHHRFNLTLLSAQYTICFDDSFNCTLCVLNLAPASFLCLNFFLFPQLSPCLRRPMQWLTLKTLLCFNLVLSRFLLSSTSLAFQTTMYIWCCFIYTGLPQTTTSTFPLISEYNYANYLYNTQEASV